MQAFQKTTLVVLVLAALLAACMPSQQNLVQVQSQVQTSVALTVQAQNDIGTFVAQTVAAQMSPTPATETATPTDTPVPSLTPVIPTPTAFSVGPSSGGGGGGGSGGTFGDNSPADSKQYHCSLVGQNPQDSSPKTILKLGDSLTVTFILQNDGKKTWEPSPWTIQGSAVDSDDPANSGLTMSPVLLSSGTTSTLAPGNTVTVAAGLTAPSAFSGRNPIRITTYFALLVEGTKLCTPYLQVEVIRPGMTP